LQLFKIRNPQFSAYTRYLLPFLIVTAILILDRITKIATLNELADGKEVVLIPGVLGLQYVENTGMAFGMFSDSTWLLVALRIVGMIAMALFIVFFDNQHILGFISFSMVLGGGIGNIIDAFEYGFVVDMIATLFVDFPVFNIADCFITVGAILLGIYLIFIHKFPEDSKEKSDDHTEIDT